jgi:hypothetical protein
MEKITCPACEQSFFGAWNEDCTCPLCNKKPGSITCKACGKASDATLWSASECPECHCLGGVPERRLENHQVDKKQRTQRGRLPIAACLLVAGVLLAVLACWPYQEEGVKTWHMENGKMVSRTISNESAEAAMKLAQQSGYSSAGKAVVEFHNAGEEARLGVTFKRAFFGVAGGVLAIIGGWLLWKAKKRPTPPHAVAAAAASIREN